MEITIDIGKHVAKQISDIALSEKIDFDIAALKILDLGIRLHLSSLDKEKENISDPILNIILNKTIESNYLLKETLGHVFNKDRSMLKTYDSMTAIAVSENMAKSYMDGNKDIF